MMEYTNDLHKTAYDKKCSKYPQHTEGDTVKFKDAMHSN